MSASTSRCRWLATVIVMAANCGSDVTPSLSQHCARVSQRLREVESNFKGMGGASSESKVALYPRCRTWEMECVESMYLHPIRGGSDSDQEGPEQDPEKLAKYIEEIANLPQPMLRNLDHVATNWEPTKDKGVCLPCCVSSFLCRLSPARQARRLLM